MIDKDPLAAFRDQHLLVKFVDFLNHYYEQKEILEQLYDKNNRSGESNGSGNQVERTEEAGQSYTQLELFDLPEEGE